MQSIFKTLHGKIIFCLAALLLAVAGGEWTERVSKGKKEVSESKDYSLSFLLSQLEQLDPSSPKAHSIRNSIARLRKEQNRPAPDSENPDPFLSALREIKTGIDGRTYGPNYRIRELQKAKIFKTKYHKRVKALPWKPRGPGNVSGRGRGMAVDPTDPSGNTWFVATIGGGVWKTTDAGDSWELKTPNLQTLSTTSIVIAPSNPDIIYLGTGMGYGRVVDLEGSGIWKSEDHGENWFQLESTANGELLEAINRIIVDPDDENILLACSNNSYTSIGPNGGDRKSGIFRSVDGGITWIQVFDPDDLFGIVKDNRVQQIIANPENFNEMYASVNEVGVVKSIDGGVTWLPSATDLAREEDIGKGEGSYSGVSTRIELAIAPSNPARIYASVERPFGTAQLRMSKDGGGTWEVVRNVGEDMNWHSANGNSGAQGAYTSGWFNNTIIVHPFDENVVFVGGVNLFKITVSPTTNTRTIAPVAWRQQANAFNVPGIHADNHFFVTIKDSVSETFRIVCPNDGGIAYSPDGGTSWIQKTGLITTQFYGVDKKPGESVYIGGTQDNGTWISTVDPGEHSVWEHVIGGDGFETVWNYRDPDLIVGAYQSGNLQRSSDGGASWSASIEARGSGGPFISRIANVKTDPDLIFTVTYDGINRSDDFGKNWQLAPLSPWIGYRPFSNVKISIANPQVVWASSRITTDPWNNTGGIYVSKNGGLSFENITSHLPPGLTEASGLATHPELEGTAFFLFSAPGVPKVLRTDDYGQTWTDISGFSVPVAKKSPTGFPDVAVFTLLVMPFDTNIIWAGTEIGLFVSEDGGDSWTLSDNGFPVVSVFDMKIVDSEVVVATYGRGIWTTEVPELVDYQPPEVVLSPRLTELAMVPDGNLKIKANLRSLYDSVHLILNNSVQTRLYNTLPETDTTISLPVSEDRTVSGKVVAFKGGKVYSSSKLETEVFITSPSESYLNLLNSITAAADFMGNGFSIRAENGFSTPAIHSPHPYPDQSELIYQLKIPIIIQPENSFLKYKDVVLVEEGTTDSHTEAGFFDFVVVEGTKDGVNWLPLAKGYDSRESSKWSSVFNNQGIGDESMYVSHEIDLLDTFQAGDLIFIRFRMLSDPAVNGWGWAIDNIIIQEETITAIGNDESYSNLKVYPNPAEDILNIKYDGGAVEEISILSLDGKIVKEIRGMKGGKISQIDILGLKKGVYLLRLRVGNQVVSTRFIKE